MDVDLARTFLEVVAAGNFVSAAGRLNVTQSAVSMRIKSLESQLGRVLFVRTKSGATLTPAGEQFRRHASAMVRIWGEARQEVALPPRYRYVLSIGAQISLWDGLMMQWLRWLKTACPELALRAQYGVSPTLMQRLVDGALDVGVMYTPQQRPGLSVEPLIEDKLVMVSTKRRQLRALDDDYVYVDWGPEFKADHNLNFPDQTVPGMIMELGSLGLRYILDNGGSGYFPRRVVEPYLQLGTLFLVRRAPVFSYPAYVVYPTDFDPSIIGPALAGLHTLAKGVAETGAAAPAAALPVAV